MPGTGRRGRPPEGPYANKIKTISTRVTGDLREALEKECERTGHSLSQEIEIRLRRSFDHDLRVETTFGGPETYWLFRLFSTAITMIEANTKKTWHQDRFTHEQCSRAVQTVMKRFRPKGPSVTPTLAFGEYLDPKDLGRAFAMGAMDQVALAEDKPMAGSVSSAIFHGTNIRRGLGELAHRLDRAPKPEARRGQSGKAKTNENKARTRNQSS